jgi:hemerythrin-like metal-binding protein
MSHVEWTDSIRLGIPGIDSDHRALLDLTNEFLTAAAQGEPPAALAAIMGRLVDRTEAHFKSEETLLDRADYPSLAAHRATHARLVAETTQLRDRLIQASGAPQQWEPITSETADYLRHWLIDHIMSEDRSFRPFVMTLA